MPTTAIPAEPTIDTVALLWTILTTPHETVAQAFQREPQLVVTIAILVVVIFWLLFILSRRSYSPRDPNKLTAAEEQRLIDEWVPEPLATKLPASSQMSSLPPLVLESATGPYAVVNGKKVLNFAVPNFLALADAKEIKEVSVKAVDKYGVGSCGPRGFYGSIDTHLQLEDVISKFFGTEEAILYSDSFACVSSLIPAFGKKGDVLMVDERCAFPIVLGATLSRSTVHFFRHNDMKHLEQLLENESKKPNTTKHRRFIVVEGLYQNVGDICPLPEIVKLKHKYAYRVIMDDTFGVGVLGKTGKGTVEHYDVPVVEIDILCGGLDATIASTGGFCVGSKTVVDHQRLSATGYCFSASAPPYTSAASIEAFSLMKKQSPTLQAKLANNAKRLRTAIKSIPGVELWGPEFSPVVHVRPTGASGLQDAQKQVDTIAAKLLEQGLAVQPSHYIAADKKAPPPTIKLFVTVGHSEADIDRAASLLRKAVSEL